MHEIFGRLIWDRHGCADVVRHALSQKRPVEGGYVRLSVRYRGTRRIARVCKYEKGKSHPRRDGFNVAAAEHAAIRKSPPTLCRTVSLKLAMPDKMAHFVIFFQFFQNIGRVSRGKEPNFFFKGCGDNRYLHSFPTRRSSD